MRTTTIARYSSILLVLLVIPTRSLGQSATTDWPSSEISSTETQTSTEIPTRTETQTSTETQAGVETQTNTPTSSSTTSSSFKCPELTYSNCNCTINSEQTLPSIRCDFTSDPSSPLLRDAASTEDGEVSFNSVDLEGNALRNLPDNFFQGVESVSHLNLKRNEFVHIPMAILRLNSVLELDMSENRMETLQVGTLHSIRNLKVLNLAYNRVVRLEYEQYQAQSTAPTVQAFNAPDLFPQMALLNLSHNQIDSIDDDFFTGMGHLISLDLSYNQLTKITEHTFHTLKFSLMALNLSNNAVKEMAPTSLQHLSHLHELNLAYNTLGNMSALEFPPHLERLDLSHSAVTDLNHCQLSSLSDLNVIALDGNDLRCSCQLYLLQVWYQNQHHAAFSAMETANSPVNWTCTEAPATPQATTTETHQAENATGPVLVRDLRDCLDTESHCHSLEHLEHHSEGNDQVQVTLLIATSGLDIVASWTVEENAVEIDGFRLNYIPEDSKAIASPVLPHDARSYTLERTEIEDHYMVCLEVLAPKQVIIRQECKNMKDEPNNVVVGIMAGVVFLLPCAVAIIYIIVKDRKIKRLLGYRAVPDAEAENASQKSHESRKCRVHEQAKAVTVDRHFNSFESADSKSLSYSNAGFVVENEIQSAKGKGQDQTTADNPNHHHDLHKVTEDSESNHVNQASPGENGTMRANILEASKVCRQTMTSAIQSSKGQSFSGHEVDQHNIQKADSQDSSQNQSVNGKQKLTEDNKTGENGEHGTENPTQASGQDGGHGTPTPKEHEHGVTNPAFKCEGTCTNPLHDSTPL